MTDYATREPLSITAGDTAAWVITLPDYPASSGWTLSYALVNSGGSISISSSSYEVDSHLVTVPPATTAAYPPGIYKWQAYVADGTDRYKVADGTLEVLPDFASQSSYDARSHARKVLDAIQATIEGTATADQLRLSVRDKMLERYPIPDLIALESRYLQLVKLEERAERISKGLGHPGIIKVRNVAF